MLSEQSLYCAQESQIVISNLADTFAQESAAEWALIYLSPCHTCAASLGPDQRYNLWFQNPELVPCALSVPQGTCPTLGQAPSPLPGMVPHMAIPDPALIL